MRKLSKHLQGCCYGLDYSVTAIKSMEKSIAHFQSIQELLKNSVFVKQQLNYEESLKERIKCSQATAGAASGGISSGAASGATVVTRQRDGAASTKRSPFQRFSGSFDIPSFNSPFAGGSIMSQLRVSSGQTQRQSLLTRHQTETESSDKASIPRQSLLTRHQTVDESQTRDVKGD